MVRRLCLSLALVLLPALPAWAGLEDPTAVLDLNVAKGLAVELSNIHADAFDIVVLRTLPADADGMAKLRFNERHGGSDTVVLMIGAQTNNMGMALGESYTQRGVTPALVKQMAARVYTPAVKKGNLGDAILDLVREIKLARTLGRDPAAQPPAAHVGGGWLPWWWYLPPVVVAAGAGGTYYWRKHQRSKRRRARLQGLVDRLEELQDQQQRLRQALAQIERAAAEGLADAALGDRDARVRQDAEALAKVVSGIGRALKEGDWEFAESGLADAEAKAFPLSVWVATTLAAHQARLRGEDVGRVLERGGEALARHERLVGAQARWAGTAPGASGPQALAERLQQLRKLLVTAPLDLQAAGDLLDATEGLYQRALAEGPVR